MIQTASILTFLEMIPELRTFRTKYRVIDIVAMAILAKICGTQGWEDMNKFAKNRQTWLQTFMELPEKVPSPDTFRRFISHIDLEAFLEAYLEWLKAVKEVLPQLVNIDVKTLRSA